MQFQNCVLTGGRWHRRHREATALAVFEQKFEILTGLVLHCLIGRKLHAENDDVVSDALHRFDAARQRFNHGVAKLPDVARFNGNVADGFGHAKQRFALGALLLGKRRGLMRAVLDDA